MLSGHFCGAGNLLKSSHMVPIWFPSGSQQWCWEPPNFRLPFRFPFGSHMAPAVSHLVPSTGAGNHQNFDSQPFPFQHQFPSTGAGNNQNFDSQPFRFFPPKKHLENVRLRRAKYRKTFLFVLKILKCFAPAAGQIDIFKRKIIISSSKTPKNFPPAAGQISHHPVGSHFPAPVLGTTRILTPSRFPDGSQQQCWEPPEY